MDGIKQLILLLQSDEAYDIETNGNFMGTRSSFADYLLKHGLGFVKPLQEENNELKSIIAENEIIIGELKRKLEEAKLKTNAKRKRLKI